MTEEELEQEAVEALGYAEASKDGLSAELSFLRKDAPPLVLTIPTERLFDVAMSLIAAANQAEVMVGPALGPQTPTAEHVWVLGGPDDGRVDLHFQLNATANFPIAMHPRTALVLFEQLEWSLEGKSGPPTEQTN